MLFGYLRDTYDWVPITLAALAVISGIMAAINTKRGKKDETKKHSGWVAVFLFLFVVTIIWLSCNEVRHQNLNIYNQGIAYEDAEEWELAANEFERLVQRNGSAFMDADMHLYYCLPRYHYSEGLRYLEDENWFQAYYHFSEATDYLLSEKMADYCYYRYILGKYPDWVNQIPDVEEIYGP